MPLKKLLFNARNSLYIGLAASIGIGACDINNIMELPASISDPDLYLKGKDGSRSYVLAESDQHGCSLAYTSQEGNSDENVFIYSGRDCGNITIYAMIQTSDELEDIVKRGKVKGEVIEMAHLTSSRMSEEKLKTIYEAYETTVENIKDKHLGNPGM